MTRMTGPDCVVMFNLINTHTHTHTPHTSPLGRINASGIEWDDRAGLRGYVQFNKNTHTHTYFVFVFSDRVRSRFILV